MALSSSSNPPPSPHLPTSSFSHLISTKLTTENYLLWKVQTSAYLRGQDLYSYIDGTAPSPPEVLFEAEADAAPKPNPAFLAWRRMDQMVLSILFSSLSESILSHVLSSTTAYDLWNNLALMFSSHSQAKEFQVRFQLTNLSRGEQTISEYFGKVRLLADSLAATGNNLSDKELVTYILNGLGPAYETFVTSITTRPSPLNSHELYQLLLIHETRISHNARTHISSGEMSANYSSTTPRDQRGRWSSRGSRNGRGRGRPYNNGRGRSSFNNAAPQYNSPRPTCQVCNKVGHVTLQCRKRFNNAFQYEAPLAPSNFSTNYTANYTA